MPSIQTCEMCFGKDACECRVCRGKQNLCKYFPSDSTARCSFRECCGEENCYVSPNIQS